MIVYEQLRGVAHLISPHPYYAPQLDLDKLAVRRRGAHHLAAAAPLGRHLSWWEAALSLLIRLHFIVPPTLVFLVWLRNRALYYRFAATILVVSFLGVIGFTLWPAAPPWMARATAGSPTSCASTTSRRADDPAPV